MRISIFLFRLCITGLTISFGSVYASALNSPQHEAENISASTPSKPASDPITNIPQEEGFPNVLAKTSPAVTKIKGKKELSILIRTKDGLVRKGILTLCPQAKGTVILCHPASHNKTFMLPYEEKLFKNFNCLRFDFRRHGEKIGGQFSTMGKKEYQEVNAAVDFLRTYESTKDLPLFGFGISMGAAVLIEAESKRHMFDGLILQSSFESLRRQVKRLYSFYRIPFMHNFIFREPTRTIAKTKYRLKLYKVRPVDSIRMIDTPIFLIHAQNDGYIPFEAFTALSSAGKSIKKVWTPESGEHTNILGTYPDLYLRNCTEFIETITRPHTANGAKK